MLVGSSVLPIDFFCPSCKFQKRRKLQNTKRDSTELSYNFRSVERRLMAEKNLTKLTEVGKNACNILKFNRNNNNKTDNHNRSTK